MNSSTVFSLFLLLLLCVWYSSHNTALIYHPSCVVIYAQVDVAKVDLALEGGG